MELTTVEPKQQNVHAKSSGQKVDWKKFSLVDNIDFSMIQQKLQSPKSKHGKGWDNEKASRAIELYKKWLYLKLEDPDAKIVPSVLIDDVWHQHILDTHAYEKDCYRVFGQFLHHFPYFGMRDEQDRANLEAAFSETQKRFETIWGHSMGTKMEASMCDGSGSQCEPNCDSGGGGGAGNCGNT